MGQLALVSDSPSNLPAELTRFVGRRRDRSELRRLLSESRLVTLTGFGGVGKTRLALHVATELQRAFPDGVRFVPLAELSDPRLLAETVAMALGIHDGSHPSDLPQLANYLRRRQLLLVLDNCEHLVDDCAVLVESLLRACPRLRVLATSRETLRIDGEVVRQVTPLSVPSPMAGVSAPIHEYEAVRLFTERAAQVVPGFTVNDENATAVIGICRQLGGIPLALELAAVRLSSMSPNEMLERLQDHWELLDLGSRGAPDRHRTMTACLAWSHSLCSVNERVLWARLSVFAGGFEMDAVQHVASAPDPVPPEQVAQLVQSLVDKSILSFELHEGRARYHMLELVRRFGVGQLEAAAQLTAARRQHRDFYVGLLRKVDAEWMSPRQVDWMWRVRLEEANIRLALQFCCIDRREAEIGLELASRLRKHAITYGWSSEARKWLHRLLALVPGPAEVRLRGLRAAFWLAAMQGDLQAGAALLDEAHRLAGELGEPSQALVDQMNALHQLFLGELTRAEYSFERALAGLRTRGELRDQAVTHLLLGITRGFAGDLDRAIASLDACLDICRSTGESWHQAHALWELGIIVWTAGDPSRAIQLETQSLDLKRRMDDRIGVVLCFEALAWMEAAGRPERAATLIGAADALWNVLGSAVQTMPGLLPLHDTCVADLRDSLGVEQFNAARTRGNAMGTVTAIAFALEEKPSRVAVASETDRGELDALTRRERQVAQLVAKGLSNQDIASTLVISRRTAEAHVEHILTKLGFNSRAQVAGWMAERAGASAVDLDH